MSDVEIGIGLVFIFLWALGKIYEWVYSRERERLRWEDARRRQERWKREKDQWSGVRK